MRTIKFRGKRIVNGDWIYGDLFREIALTPTGRKRKSEYNGFLAIQTETPDGIKSYSVDQETVGQFTDFYDTNGQPIFEGDILKCRIKKFEHIPNVVGYRLGLFEISPNNQNQASSPLKYLLNDDEGNTLNSWTIIGNIHDNPELLKGGAK